MPNQLQHEKSPYLLQHADNPVDWYPWCDEAFEKARNEDKPIFLSIGYSTCHWCHVMAHESFEDPELAEMMNETFVNVKVDREERPDIDDIYMTVCQSVTGRGGWPLTIVMTPDQEPFFAATYLPKESRGRQIGMYDLIPKIQTMWEENREEVRESAQQVMDALHQMNEEAPGDELSEEVPDRCARQMKNQFDSTYGGFGNEPKFPSPHQFLFLLRYGTRTEQEEPIEMVKTTLTSMRQGGIFDQVGYGFHRYSTDREWFLPHFEKMLYDQALLGRAYLETYQVTDEPLYRETAEQVLEYVSRDLTSDEGAFYSAEDADSEEGEGAYYQWTLDELRDILGEEDARLARTVYQLEPEGNFREEASGEKTGRNILHPGRSMDQIAEELDLSKSELNQRLSSIREQLFEAREERTRPHLDDKVLTSWNGLMISTFAYAGRILDRDDYKEQAINAAEFLLDTMRTDQDRLLHRYRDGDAAVPGNAEDYAFFILGLLDLYEATFTTRYLRIARSLQNTFLNHFRDQNEGGFFFTPDDGEELITRKKTVRDGAKPSSNSVAYYNLLRLSHLTGETAFEEHALDVETAFSDNITSSPYSFAMFLCGLEFRLGEHREIVVAGPGEDENTQSLLREVQSKYLPESVLLFRPTDREQPEITELAPFTENQTDLDGEAALYVCTNFACQQPTTDLENALS